MAPAASPKEFHYRIPWRAYGSYPGFHSSRQAGSGSDFQGLVGLLEARDPRRFDLRASLRDPCRELKFRIQTQRSAIPVYALADVSASMDFVGVGRKLEVLADFVAALGYSAYRTGDPLAVFACDESVRWDLHEPLRWNRMAGHRTSADLRILRPAGRSSEGLLAAAGLCRRQRGLVFLLSDFHFPLGLLDQVLAALVRHHAIPVMLRDDTETALPRFGLARVRDPETGEQRVLWLRPSLRARLVQQAASRQEQLERRFAAFGLRPLVLINHFDADAVTRYFHA